MAGYSGNTVGRTYSLRVTLATLVALATLLVQTSVTAASPPIYTPVTPACEKPAPLYGKWKAEAPGFLIGYKSNIKSYKQATRALSKTHQFKVDMDFPDIKLFYVKDLRPQQVAALRCEPSISYIEHDATMGIAAKPAVE